MNNKYKRLAEELRKHRGTAETVIGDLVSLRWTDDLLVVAKSWNTDPKKIHIFLGHGCREPLEAYLPGFVNQEELDSLIRNIEIKENEQQR